mgnify:CR=1 FL=1
MELKFVIDTPPDEECLIRSHKTLAKGLINRYGIETMKRVVAEYEKSKKQQDKLS